MILIDNVGDDLLSAEYCATNMFSTIRLYKYVGDKWYIWCTKAGGYWTTMYHTPTYKLTTITSFKYDGKTVSFTLEGEVIPQTVTGTLSVDKPNTHSHYFKHCPYEYVDVYRVIELFSVIDPCLQHALKKLLVAGGRGHKDIARDVQDVIDSCERWRQMRGEE